ncbi:MAG: SurA N-terminal domain-containing protein [Prevotellaceae bacterium]|jgi:peptidyl-prolyl cis-trans isomerase D|nr:SurA N-terminal domain-containing protein [Prevotellaceae bacterium]
MAVLETLRKKAGVFLVGIIGISLLSFVLGDMFGSQGGGGLFGSGQSLGEMNGTTISYEEYQREQDYYTAIYQIMYGQNASNEAMVDEAREQAWQSLVRKNVFDSKYSRLGLRVSSDELFDLIQGRNPSPLVVNINNFTNPQTGEFDRGSVLRYLQSLDQNPNPDSKTYWLFLEKEIVQQRLQTKLMNLVSSALYVTNLDAKNMLSNTANTVSIQYVQKPFSSVPDSAVKVTSSDVKKYYNAHKQQYRQTASRDVEYVAFPIVPSAEDDQATREWIAKLAPEFKASTDVRQFVTLNSDVPFDATYYAKGQLPEPLDNFAFSASKADMLNSILDGGSYKMARIADVRMLPDSVRARHILLDGQRGLEATRTLADSIRTALRRGANFEALMTKYSVDQVANQQGGDLGWFGQNAMVRPFGDSCFFAPRGRTMVIETQFGIHIAQVTDKGVEQKKVQLAVVERALEPSRTTRERIFANANEFATAAGDYATFTAKAAEKGYAKQTAPRITINDRNVQGLQQARDLVRWAYEQKKSGNISGVFEISNNFVVAALKEVREDGYADVDQVASEISAEVLREKKADLAAAEMSGAADLSSLAQQLNATVGTIADVNFASFYLTNVGVEPGLAAAASVAKEGQISTPVKGYSGTYVFSATARTDKATDAMLPQEKQRLQETVPMRVGYELFEALRTQAEIKDWRGKVLF